MEYQEIINFIPHGRSRAISLNTLSNLTQKSKQTVKKAVSEARLNGQIILSSTKHPAGYFKPSVENEFFECQEYIRTVMKGIRSNFDHIRPIREHLNSLTRIEEVSNEQAAVQDFATNCQSNIPKTS